METRSYHYLSDKDSINRLLLKTRSGKQLKRCPTFWRLQQLLVTRLWEPEHNARIWEDAHGTLTGIAYLPQRRPKEAFRSFAYLIDPEIQQAGIFQDMLQWAETRIKAEAVQNSQDTWLYTSTLIDPEKQALLQKNQWTMDSTDSPNYDLYMSCFLDHLPVSPESPAPFTIRRLSMKSELDAYMQLFGFAAMSRAHRSELLDHSNEYAHFVAEAETGKLVAYCECSIWREEWKNNQPKIGWIDYIGTLPDFKRRGLGRAVLQAALNQLYSWGAEEAMLTTMGSNTTAQSVFQAAGFQPAEKSFNIVKTINHVKA